MRVAWVCLVIVSLGILGFGVITVLPSVARGNLLIVANGLASIGLGLFGGLIVVIPFRRGDRWAWLVLWFYPLFWLVHLVADLPPGKDHIHQIVFTVLSAAGLLLPVRDMIGAGRPPTSRTRSGA